MMASNSRGPPAGSLPQTEALTIDSFHHDLRLACLTFVYSFYLDLIFFLASTFPTGSKFLIGCYSTLFHAVQLMITMERMSVTEKTREEPALSRSAWIRMVCLYASRDTLAAFHWSLFDHTFLWDYFQKLQKTDIDVVMVARSEQEAERKLARRYY